MPNQSTFVADSPEPMCHQIISTYLDNRSVTDTAAKCKTSAVKVRKVLITEGLWSSRTSIEVQHYLNLGSANDYDYHTLVKVSQMAGLYGIIGFHEAGEGYLLSFPDNNNTRAQIHDFKARLKDLENNIWMH